MIVHVSAIIPSNHSGASNAVATYDVKASIAQQDYTFRVWIEEDRGITAEGRALQIAHFCDDNHERLFLWHQAFWSKIAKLVFAVHNGEVGRLPVDLDES